MWKFIKIIRLATLFERPFFDKLNSDILKNEFQNEADFSVCKVNDEDNEKVFFEHLLIFKTKNN